MPWTPASETIPIRWSLEPFDFTRSTAPRQTPFEASRRSVKSLLIRTSSWFTTRPAPMFSCPTSLLPMTPSGRPTSRPLALTRATGYLLWSMSSQGFVARCVALKGILLGMGVVPPAVADHEEYGLAR
jgi:hypothetical protein